MEFEKMPKFCQLAIQIFINGIEPLLELFLREFADRIVCWVVIHIWQEDGL